MSAKAFIEELTGRGVALEATPEGNLRFAPKEKLSAGDVERLKAFKGEILKIFSCGKSYVPSPPSPSSSTPGKPDTYGEYSGDDHGDDPGDGDDAIVTIPAPLRAARERASELGLVARWSYEFGYVAIHDPTTGEWHETPTKQAPGWAKREASKRKELSKKGVARTLTGAEMEELWEEEQAPMWSEPYRPADARDGLIYE